MKRRPTALDRNIVDWIEKLPPGNYMLEIPSAPDAGTYLGLARLKREGHMNILRGDGSIKFSIYPAYSPYHPATEGDSE